MSDLELGIEGNRSIVGLNSLFYESLVPHCVTAIGMHFRRILPQGYTLFEVA